MNSSARNWCVPSYRTWTVRTTQKRSGAGPIRPTRPARAPCRWSAQPSGTFFYLIWFDLTLFFFSTAVLSFNSGWWLLSLPAGRDDVDDGVFTGFFFAGVRSYFEEGGGQDGEGRGQGKKTEGTTDWGGQFHFLRVTTLAVSDGVLFHTHGHKNSTLASVIFFFASIFFSLFHLVRSRLPFFSLPTFLPALQWPRCVFFPSSSHPFLWRSKKDGFFQAPRVAGTFWRIASSFEWMNHCRPPTGEIRFACQQTGFREWHCADFLKGLYENVQSLTWIPSNILVCLDWFVFLFIWSLLKVKSRTELRGVCKKN